jgi:hypothetical protein
MSCRGSARRCTSRCSSGVDAYRPEVEQHDLLAAGLLDELRLWVHPFVGSGTADDLLYRTGSTGRFALVDATTLDSGIVILTYRC